MQLIGLLAAGRAGGAFRGTRLGDVASTARSSAGHGLFHLDRPATMDAPLKELAKLDKLTAGTSSAKGKAPSIDQSLDALLESLRNAKERFSSGTGSQATLETLVKRVEEKKKEIDDRQKEVYNALAKFGKALDKVRCLRAPAKRMRVSRAVQKFTNPLPSYEPLFTSLEAKAALERTMAIHFMRTGQFGIAETFLSVSTLSSITREGPLMLLFPCPTGI